MENCTEFPQKTKKTTIWSNNFTSGYLFEESENIIWNDRYAYVCCCCLVTKSCLTPCNPMDCSLSGSFVHGIFPGKNTGESCHFLLQGSSWPRDQTRISCVSFLGRQILNHWATREAPVLWVATSNPLVCVWDKKILAFSVGEVSPIWKSIQIVVWL